MRQMKSLSLCLHTQNTNYYLLFAFAFFASKIECQFDFMVKANLVLLKHVPPPSSSAQLTTNKQLWDTHMVSFPGSTSPSSASGTEKQPQCVSPASIPRKVSALASVTCTQVLLPFNPLQPTGQMHFVIFLVRKVAKERWAHLAGPGLVHQGHLF